MLALTMPSYYYRPFDDELVEIKGNYLKMYDSKHKTWDKIKKVPDSINIFSSHDE